MLYKHVNVLQCILFSEVRSKLKNQVNIEVVSDLRSLITEIFTEI